MLSISFKRKITLNGFGYNGKWLGKIPTQLQDLSYAEQLLIARICHN